jgi:ligand-binding sensor domain-containing protein
MKFRKLIGATLLFSQLSAAAGLFTNVPLTDKIYDLAFSKDAAWLGTNNGVIKMDLQGTILARYKPKDGLASYTVYAVCVEHDTVKWFGTGMGVSRFDDHTWDTLNTTDGLYSNQVQEIVIDQQGAKWFGTIDGSTKYNDTTFVTVRNGFPNKVIKEIAIGHNNYKWFATGWGIVIWGDTSKVINFDQRQGLGSVEISCLTVAADSTVWIGSSGGVNYMKENKYREYPVALYSESDGLASNTVYDITADRFGNVWMGTLAGVSRFNPVSKEWTTYDTSNGLLNNSVKSIGTDPQGNLWFCTLKGISIFNAKDPVVPNRSSTHRVNGMVSIYPNPSCLAATVSYSLASAQKVEAALYNLQGELVQSVSRGTQSAGRHDLVLTTALLQPGTYLCKLRADGRELSGTRLTILK